MDSPVKIAVLVSGGGTNLQALIDSEKRGTRACDMEAAVKCGNGKPGMAGSVGGDIERFDFVGGCVFDEFFAAGVSLLCLGAFLQQFAPLGIKIGYRDDFNVGMRLIGELRAEAADSFAGNAHSDLFVRERRPLHIAESARVTLIETLYDFIFFTDACTSGRCENRGSRTHETSSADHSLSSFATTVAQT